MDISNLTQIASAAPSVTKVAGTSATTKSAPQGNSLPGLGQVPAAVETSASKETAAQLDSTELNNLVDKANETLQGGRFSNLKFTVAEGTNINVVRIEDTETGELIRQVPSETMIAIARAVDEALQGTMLKETV